LRKNVGSNVKQNIVTPIKPFEKDYGDRSTAIKTTTIKKTTTINTTKMEEKPRTSIFDAGNVTRNSIRESHVVSNKIF
jgi:hypothetical protein